MKAYIRTFSFEGVRFLFTFNSLKFGELFIHSWYNGNIITHFCKLSLIEICLRQYHVECYAQYYVI